MSTSNKYKLSAPIDGEGKPRKYAQYVMALSNGEEKTKKQILTETGTDTSSIILRGYGNKPLKLLKDNEVIEYNKSNKKWKLGPKGKEFLKKVENQITEFNLKQ